MMGLFASRKNALPMGNVEIATAHGLGARDSQQDSFAVAGKDCGELGMLAVVADGMGGLVNSGQLSTAIVTAMTDAYAPGGDLEPQKQLFLLLKQAVLQAAELTGDKTYQSGSTLVACLLRQNGLSWVSVGDSRVYLWRSGGLIPLSRDHDFAGDLAVMTLTEQFTWDEIKTNPRREALTSYIGAELPRYVDYNREPVRLLRGDKIILMTDGVYRALSASELSDCLDRPAAKTAAMIEKKIKEKRLSHQDNYTAVVLEMR